MQHRHGRLTPTFFLTSTYGIFTNTGHQPRYILPLYTCKVSPHGTQWHLLYPALARNQYCDRHTLWPCKDPSLVSPSYESNACRSLWLVHGVSRNSPCNKLTLSPAPCNRLTFTTGVLPGCEVNGTTSSIKWQNLPTAFPPGHNILHPHHGKSLGVAPVVYIYILQCATESGERESVSELPCFYPALCFRRRTPTSNKVLSWNQYLRYWPGLNLIPLPRQLTPK